MRTITISLRGTQLWTLHLMLVPLVFSGCAGPSVPATWPEPKESEPFEVGTRIHERHDSVTGALLRRWRVTTGSDGVPLLDGADEAWWPDGSRRHERRWVMGEEAGSWQSWHPNGAVRSSASFDSEPGTMRFWHPNGALAAEGPHRAGTRVGVWTFWHEGGARQSEGSFSENRRVGAWTFWRENGGLEAAGMYAGGRRVGEWDLVPAAEEETKSGSRPDE